VYYSSFAIYSRIVSLFRFFFVHDSHTNKAYVFVSVYAARLNDFQVIDYK